MFRSGRIPNSKGHLQDGMSVRVVLEAAQPLRALVIPQASILRDQLGSYILTVEPRYERLNRPGNR